MNKLVAEPGVAYPNGVVTARREAPSSALSATPAVFAAIAAVMAALAKEGIAKNGHNKIQDFAFRGIDDIYNALAPALAAARLVIVPRVLSRECEARRTAKDALIYSVAVLVEYTLISADDGSRQVAVAVGEAMDSGDKATSKAMSAAYKYMAIQTFCIPTAGDNDADAHTPPETKDGADASPSEAQMLEVCGKYRGKLQECESVAAVRSMWERIEAHSSFKLVDARMPREVNKLLQHRDALIEKLAKTASELLNDETPF
jgi:hypothetical protein